MKIAILTTEASWFVDYIFKLEKHIKKLQYDVRVFFKHEEIDQTFDVVFILSYHRIIPKKNLALHKHNLVVHASALPKGKGWAPFFWQVIEGKSDIPFTLFEAGENVDDGLIYIQKYISLNGHELYEDLRKIQVETTINICLDFLINYDSIIPKKQIGEESFYKKRTAIDSKLNVEKSIKEQFNLLRTVSNDDFPAFFEIDGHRYLVKIEHDTRGELK